MEKDFHAFSVEIPIWQSEVDAFRNAFDLPANTDFLALFNALMGTAANEHLKSENFDGADIRSLVRQLEA